MKCLPTGGTGYIGSHTALALVQAGHEVVLYDNLCNSKASGSIAWRSFWGSARFLCRAISAYRLLTEVLRQHAVMRWCILQGRKAVGESERAKPVDYANNAGTVSLLQAMQAAQVNAGVQFQRHGLCRGICRWMRTTPPAPPIPMAAANCR